MRFDIYRPTTDEERRKEQAEYMRELATHSLQHMELDENRKRWFGLIDNIRTAALKGKSELRGIAISDEHILKLRSNGYIVENTDRNFRVIWGL